MKKIIGLVIAMTLALASCSKLPPAKQESYAPSTLEGKTIFIKYPKGSIKKTALYAQGKFTKNHVIFYPVPEKNPPKIAKNYAYYTYTSSGNSAVLVTKYSTPSNINNPVVKGKILMTFSNSNSGSFVSKIYYKKQGKWVQQIYKKKQGKWIPTHGSFGTFIIK
jgi:hypothetical protein